MMLSDPTGLQKLHRAETSDRAADTIQSSTIHCTIKMLLKLLLLKVKWLYNVALILVTCILLLVCSPH